jgi:hypothetical protein
MTTRLEKLTNAVYKIYDAFKNNVSPIRKQRIDSYKIYIYNGIFNYNMEERTFEFQDIKFQYTNDEKLIPLKLIDSNVYYTTWMCSKFLYLVYEKFGDISDSYDLGKIVSIFSSYDNNHVWDGIPISSLNEISYTDGILRFHDSIHQPSDQLKYKGITIYRFQYKIIKEYGLKVIYDLEQISNNSDTIMHQLCKIFYKSKFTDENYEIYKYLIRNPNLIQNLYDLKRSANTKLMKKLINDRKNYILFNSKLSI